MKKTLKTLAMIIGVATITLTGCNQAERVSQNLAEEADNFNCYRQISVINCLQGDVIFQMTGRFSINADVSDNQLEVTVELEDGTYKKHFIGLSDNVTYVIEDITSKDVSKYAYELNFNPKMWLPVTVDYKD